LETDLVYYPYRYYSPSTGRWLSRDPVNEPGFALLTGRKAANLDQEKVLYQFVENNPVNETDPLGLCDIKIRCNPVVYVGITVGWHCGVIAPSGVQYDIGGVGIGGSSGGTPVVFPISTNQAPQPVETPSGLKDYPVSCGKCSSCDSIQKCIQNYHDTVTPPTYFALGPNSNTCAHNMLNTCGCSVNPIQLPCYTVLRPPKLGGPYLYCPTPTTTPPGAIGWNHGF
jgi:RHS repeat-associated protein